MTFGAVALFAIVVITYGMMRWLRPEMYPGQGWFSGTRHDVERAVLHLDFGRAYTWRDAPRIHDMWVTGIGPDLSLLIGGFAIGVVGGVLGGVLCATWPRSLFSRALEGFSMIAYCAPVYAVGMATLLLFNSTFGIWKVPYFFEALPTYRHPDEDPLAWFRAMLVPCLLIGAPIGAACLRLTMALTVEELESDHVRAAWAKGLRDEARARRDGAVHGEGECATGHPGLQALALWAGLLIVVMSIAVDGALAALDPRVRTSEAAR